MEWLNIPGYESYVICKETLDVKNNISGKILSKKGGSVRLSYRGKQRNFTPNRLLYCAIKGYEIDKVPSDIIVVKEHGQLFVSTRSELSRKAIEKTNKTIRENKLSYEDIKTFVDIVLRFKKSGDSTELLKNLYSYRKKAIGYCLKNRYVLSENEASELVDLSIENIIKRIRSGMVVVFPFNYIIGTVRSIRRKIAIHRKTELLIEDVYEKNRII